MPAQKIVQQEEPFFSSVATIVPVVTTAVSPLLEESAGVAATFTGFEEEELAGAFVDADAALDGAEAGAEAGAADC